MVVCPVDTAGSVRLADARLLWEIAPILSYLAHQPAHATICLDLHIKPCFEEQVETAYALLTEGQAKVLHAAIRVLYDKTRMMFLPGGVRWYSV